MLGNLNLIVLSVPYARCGLTFPRVPRIATVYGKVTLESLINSKCPSINALYSHFYSYTNSKILQTSNADDEYNTGSDHSQEEGIATTSRVTFRPSGANFGETAIIAPLVNKHEIPKGESAKKATALQADAVPEGNSLVSKSGPEASLLLNTNMPSGSATLADIPSPEGSNPNEAELLTGEPVDALIRDEASFSKLTPQKQCD